MSFASSLVSNVWNSSRISRCFQLARSSTGTLVASLIPVEAHFAWRSQGRPVLCVDEKKKKKKGTTRYRFVGRWDQRSSSHINVSRHIETLRHEREQHVLACGFRETLAASHHRRNRDFETQLSGARPDGIRYSINSKGPKCIPSSMAGDHNERV